MIRHCGYPQCEALTSGYCPRCDGGFPPIVVPPILHGQTLPGCICPPTSEQTCGNPMCPRKSPTPAEKAGTKGIV